MGAARILASQEWVPACHLLLLLLAWLTLSDHSERQYAVGITSQKTTFLIVTDMRILNPIICRFLLNSDMHYPFFQHTIKVYVSIKILRYLSSV
jgi:hypothetical protein